MHCPSASICYCQHEITYYDDFQWCIFLWYIITFGWVTGRAYSAAYQERFFYRRDSGKKLWGSSDWFTCKMPIKMHVVMVRYSSVVALLLDLLDVKIWERSLGMILLECNTRPCYGDVLIFCVCVVRRRWRLAAACCGSCLMLSMRRRCSATFTLSYCLDLTHT